MFIRKIGITHVVFEVKQFREYEDQKTKNCKNAGKIPVFSCDEIDQRYNRDCRCHIACRNKGHGNQQEVWPFPHVFEQECEEDRDKPPVHQQELDRIRRRVHNGNSPGMGLECDIKGHIGQDCKGRDRDKGPPGKIMQVILQVPPDNQGGKPKRNGGID